MSKRNLTRQTTLSSFLSPKNSRESPQKESSPAKQNIEFSDDDEFIANVADMPTGENIAELNNSYDIGNYDTRKIDESTKYLLATSHFKPPADFEWPYTEKISRGRIEKLRSSQAHLDEYSWLVMSSVQKGYFCLPCALMLNKGAFQNKVGKIELGQLVCTALTNFAKIREKLANHNKHGYHKSQVESLEHFKRNYKDSSKSIIGQLDSRRKELVKFNREMLRVIAQTVIFCGKQGIGLRGHRDWGLLEETDENSGNFR